MGLRVFLRTFFGGEGDAGRVQLYLSGQCKQTSKQTSSWTPRYL